MRATSGKVSGRVELPHCTLGGLPDVAHSLPYFFLLGALLVAVPVGTNLALFWLLWALISGQFLVSRGAVFPALATLGLPADAVRRSSAVLTYGHWTIQALLRAWHNKVRQEGRWHAHTYEGFRPVVCDLVGFFRPQLSGCVGKHYQSGANKARSIYRCL